MLVSLNWLKELVDIEADPQVLARRLTDTGAEVEDMEIPAPRFGGAVTARIERLEKHPSRGDLLVARVVAEDRNGICVTAATNLSAGDLVPWGPPGCTLSDGAVLGPRDFEGVVSEGMMLSAEEIGFPDLASEFGILRLDADTPVGVDVRKALGLDDVILDVAITPNRGDLLGMTGMAREVYGVIADSKLKRYDLPVPGENRDWSLDFSGVTLSDPDCPVYGLGLATGIRIAPSPVWVRMRLILAGMRPVSNIVDATNLMMLMTGQPLHAFDADRLPAPEITVRPAKNGERLVTLDEKERLLTEEDLVISSGGEAVGLAGVMGGANSEIWEGTRNVLLESAHFRGPRVSRTYRRLGLTSEAAYRFARTVDPRKAEPALKATLVLMDQWGAANVEGWMIEGTADADKHHPVTLTPEKLQTYLLESDMDEASGILERFGFSETCREGRSRCFLPPSWRPDVTIEEDLIEEVARVRGYDDMPAILPAVLRTPGDITDRMRTERALRGAATGRGYVEAVTYSFVSAESIRLLYGHEQDDDLIMLSNPLSRDQAVMRPSLAPGLVHAAAENFRKGWRTAVRLFETGMVFGPGEIGKAETIRAAGVVCPGRDTRSPWGEQQTDDFFTVKGDVAALCESRHLTPRWTRGLEPFGHEGQTAHIWFGERKMGCLARLKPAIERELDLPAPMYVFEFDMEPLIANPLASFGAGARFPAVHRDVALIAATGIESGEIRKEIEELAGELLDWVEVFDVYEGKGIPEGSRSLAFSLAYRHSERTLRDEEVDDIHEALRKELSTRGYTLR